MFLFFPENPGWSYQMMRLLAEESGGGADFFELLATAQRMTVGDPESWHQEWMRTASELESRGKEALKAGHRVTAKALFLRAANYYRNAEFFLAGWQDERKVPTYLKCVSCFRSGAALFDPPVDRVRIPYEGTSLSGYLFSAGPQTPALIALGGADALAEEFYFLLVPEANARGISCLIMDGPGQGGPLRTQKIHSRHDYEIPVSCAVEHLQQTADVDPDRIAIIGASFGGYYVARAAAFEKRIKACIVWGANYEVEKDLYDFYPPIQRQVQWLLGACSDADARRKLKLFTLRGVADKITCPLLITHGEDDRLVNVEAAHKTYEDAAGPKELKVWPSGRPGSTHCQVDNLPEARAYMLDWVDDILGG